MRVQGLETARAASSPEWDSDQRTSCVANVTTVRASLVPVFSFQRLRMSVRQICMSSPLAVTHWRVVGFHQCSQTVRVTFWLTTGFMLDAVRVTPVGALTLIVTAALVDGVSELSQANVPW